jgi:hypothetical protein
MKLYLAGFQAHHPLFFELKPRYVLESFFYLKAETFQQLQCELFLLDSGAFTFLNTPQTIKSGSLNWDDYVRRYADFINAHQIKQFFELDIDAVVGLPEVERLRRLLEQRTGQACIPVWHRSRGRAYWEALIREYRYIALGGIALRHITKSEHRYFPALLDSAHAQGCRVHGLGFSPPATLHRYPFDSVDSTTWNGNRYGRIYYFENGKIKIKIAPGKRIITEKVTAARRCSLAAWVQFQRMLDER